MDQKVLLVTLWGYKNFGNRLQALALKKVLEELGFSVVCASYDNRSLKQKLKQSVKALLGWIGISRYFRVYQKCCRSHALKKSRDLFSPETVNIRGFKTAGNIDPDDYAMAVSGSDQVWHGWRGCDELRYFYLDFMPEKKRISYGASFGFEVFPEKDRETHMEGLKGMAAISCREESGCSLVEQMTGRRGELVLDPTLCVESSVWQKLEEKPGYVGNDPFLLMNLLGDSSDYLTGIRRYAEENGLEIIDLQDFHRRDVWNTTLGGFLWLVHHADMVCTDSFHCTVFSILFERPFQVFRRCGEGFENMFDRIYTLLRMTGTEGCQYDGSHVRWIGADYGDVRGRIEKERAGSVDWLKRALAGAADS